MSLICSNSTKCKNVATVFCYTCGQLCPACNESIHSFPIFKSHLQKSLKEIYPKCQNFKQCANLATIKCQQCGLLCKDCDTKVHLMEMFKSHIRAEIQKAKMNTYSPSINRKDQNLQKELENTQLIFAQQRRFLKESLTALAQVLFAVGLEQDPETLVSDWMEGTIPIRTYCKQILDEVRSIKNETEQLKHYLKESRENHQLFLDEQKQINNQSSKSNNEEEEMGDIFQQVLQNSEQLKIKNKNFSLIINELCKPTFSLLNKKKIDINKRTLFFKLENGFYKAVQIKENVILDPQNFPNQKNENNPKYMKGTVFYSTKQVSKKNDFGFRKNSVYYTVMCDDIIPYF
ncbi:b-box zinc finger protein [Anaeramoeba flamelloides]|uniref:B-box zinc finger protein n=1 Tax=Anaeramoeba flamelloides TaxID=1746091 RepID=A0ABQ8X3R4_9EUKA|nr:b-box zinc finger protein [Anaeramoeba flamelloides]